MKSTRRWFYLTGSLTVLVLALMGVLWAMSVAAAPSPAAELTKGELTTVAEFVSPDTSTAADIASGDRLIEVTLTNAALNIPETVQGAVDGDGDFPAVIIVLTGDRAVNNVIVVDINANSVVAASANAGNINLQGSTSAQVLPIIGSVTIDFDESDVTDGEVRLDEVLNSEFGTLTMRALTLITASPGTPVEIHLNFGTSPQETALVNIKGESGAFDLLLVEDPDGPEGVYDSSVVVADEIILNMNTLVHEQEDVPGGLQGNIDVDAEEHEQDTAVVIGAEFFVTVDNPPIRDLSGGVLGTGDDITVEISGQANPVFRGVNATTGRIRLEAAAAIEVGDTVEVTYRGSDSFDIGVDFAPLRTLGNTAATITTADTFNADINNIFRVPSDTDDLADADDSFLIISVNRLTGIIKVGVIVGDAVADEKDPVDLDDHITVLGISYAGSESVAIGSAVSAGASFSVDLDLAPDANVTIRDVSAINDRAQAGQDATNAVAAAAEAAGDTTVGTRQAAGEAALVISGTADAVADAIEAATSVTAAIADARLINTGGFAAGGAVADAVIAAAQGASDVGSAIGVVQAAARYVSDRAAAASNAAVVASGDALQTGDGVAAHARTIAATAATNNQGTAEEPIRNSVAGTTAVFTGGAIGHLSGEVFTVSYPFEAGFNPQNALIPANCPLPCPRPIVLASSGNRVSIASDDDKVSVTSEADPPEFANPTPTDGSATDDIAETLQIEIFDDLAGVDAATVEFLVSDDSDDIADAVTFGDDRDNGGEEAALITVTPQGDVTVAEVDLDEVDEEVGGAFNVPDDATTIVRWWVRATDEVGNTDISDADDDTAGDQPFTLRVDNEDPDIDGVVIGDHWDSDDERIEGDRRDLLGSSEKDTIRVEFNEPLDGTSISPSDFSVTDTAGNLLTITDVMWFDEDSTGDLARSSVFLVLEEVLASGALVNVELIGSVSDAAGNSVTAVTVEADDVTDGIAPTPSISVDTELSDEAVVITVETDEDIRTLRPVLELCREDDDDDDTDGDCNPVTERPTKAADVNVWTYSLDITRAGQYSVVVTAEDDERNSGASGERNPADDDAVTFEIDNDIPNPATTDPADDPNGDSPATFADPFFIEVSWNTSEDSEYDGDSNDEVTITRAELDDVDVVSLSSTRDGERWTIAILGIELGDHELVIDAVDTAGNELEDFSIEFTLEEREAWELGLVPGMNLISIPAEPADDGINAIFGETEEVDLIFTREGDVWLVAQRDRDTDLFESTGAVSDLTTIDSKHAYWVRASASVTVDIDIPPLGAQQLLPTIGVKGGEWNLVPVISLDSLSDIGQFTAVDGDDYLGDDWNKAFTFDQGVWHSVLPGTGDDGKPDTLDDSLQIGRGYWVFFTEDGTLTP